MNSKVMTKTAKTCKRGNPPLFPTGLFDYFCGLSFILQIFFPFLPLIAMDHQQQHQQHEQVEEVQNIDNHQNTDLGPALGPNLKWLRSRWGIVKVIQLFFGLLAIICGAIVVTKITGAAGSVIFIHDIESTADEHYRRFFLFTSITAFSTTAILFVIYFGGFHSYVPRVKVWCLVVSHA